MVHQEAGEATVEASVCTESADTIDFWRCCRARWRSSNHEKVSMMDASL